MQQSFNPVDYTFEWTKDWYKWDYKLAHKLARKARNRVVKELRKQGYQVKVFTFSNQRITRGGIGTGKPHIDLIVNVYYLEAE